VVEFLLTLGGEEKGIKYVCLKKNPKNHKEQNQTVALGMA